MNELSVGYESLLIVRSHEITENLSENWSQCNLKLEISWVESFNFYVILSARSHDYGRQAANDYGDDYDDDYYSYDNSAAMSFSGFGGVSYNPNEDDDDDDDDSEDEDDESDTEDETEDEESEKENDVGEITNGVDNL